MANMYPLKKKSTKKKKYGTIRTLILKWIRETQFHGANRLAGEDASWYWIPLMTILLVCCILLVLLIISRYVANPTYMVYLDAGNYKLAFPSIIICPEVTFSVYKMEEFLAKLKYPDGLNESYVRKVLPQLAVFFNPDVHYMLHDLLNLENLLKYNEIDIETAGRRMTSSCAETLIRCRWQNEFHNCSQIFRMELTRDGFCCVFNGRSLRREMKTQYPIKKNFTRIYTNRFGFTSGLMVAINQTQRHWNIDLSYKWIAIQDSQRFVDATFNGTALNPGAEQWFYYYAYGLHITDGARELSTSLRKCTFDDEEMEYFPVYKKKYCIVECEMAETIKRCQCVRIVHPQPQGIPYCGVHSLECTRKVSTSNCNCLPTCNLDSAELRASTFNLDTSMASFDRFYENLDYKRVTVVRTFIQKRRTIIKERWPYYTYLDVFAQLGGMFNVFFGCSILTILGILHAFWSIALTTFRLIKPEKKQRNLYKFVK